MHFQSEIQDIQPHEPFKDEFYIKVSRPVKKDMAEAGRRRRPSSNTTGRGGKKLARSSHPEVHKVEEKDWDDHDFNKNSAMRVVITDESYDFFVNIDNKDLKWQKKLNTRIQSNILTDLYAYGMGFIGFALVSDEENLVKKGGANQADDEDIYELVRKVSESISPLLIPMIEVLSTADLSEPASENGLSA